MLDAVEYTWQGRDDCGVYVKGVFKGHVEQSAETH
jgi:hypothetical protein